MERLQGKSISVLCVKMYLLCGWPSLASGRLESSWNPNTVWGPSVDAEGTVLDDFWLPLLIVIVLVLLEEISWGLSGTSKTSWLYNGTWSSELCGCFFFPRAFICLVFVCVFILRATCLSGPGRGSAIEITDSLFWDPGTESSSLSEEERRDCGCFLLSLAKSCLFSSLNLFLSAVSSPINFRFCCWIS